MFLSVEADDDEWKEPVTKKPAGSFKGLTNAKNGLRPVLSPTKRKNGTGGVETIEVQFLNCNGIHCGHIPTGKTIGMLEWLKYTKSLEIGQLPTDTALTYQFGKQLVDFEYQHRGLPHAHLVNRIRYAPDRPRRDDTPEQV